MIGQFTLRNMTTQSQIELGQDSSKDYLIPEGGVDWGKATASHNTFSYPGQAGVYISSTSLRARDISISGYISYVMSESERISVKPSLHQEYCYNKILQRKNFLNEVVNPLDYVRILVGDYAIDGKPSGSVVFGKTSAENNIYFCRFTFSLYCPYPLFKRLSKIEVPLNGVTPNFHFPLVFPSGEGIVLSVRRSYQLIAVNNDGAIPVGCIIRLKSSGRVVNPKIENVYTRESLTIRKTLEQGEEIIINTNDGEEKGISGPDGENYFKYWDFSNDWLKIPVGSSLIGYSVESDNASLLDVSIELSPAKYVLEEM